MSRRELTRVEVMARVKVGTRSLGTAAGMLALSCRQAQRLWRRYRAVGEPSNRGVDGRVRQRALTVIREKYSGPIGERFGPTLAAEHLAAEDGLQVHHETLRRWMLAAGLWSRTRKRLPYRQRRERKAHAGELVQMDGSFHAWVERRSPTVCLITLVDDATSQSLGRFSEQETIWAAVDVPRCWLETHGIPQARFTDWKNVYGRGAAEAERAAGVVPQTPFGRMYEALGIAIIAAHSPQAKGRIERNHGTHQDRLGKKLRRLGPAMLEAGNAFLTRTYWPEHNLRFTRPAASTDDVHRRCPMPRQLDATFHLEEVRTIGGDWIVWHHNRFLQLKRHSGQAPARSTATVCEWRDGRLAVDYCGRAMEWHEWSPTEPRCEPVPVPRVEPPVRKWRLPCGTDHPRRRNDGDDGHRTVKLWPALNR